MRSPFARPRTAGEWLVGSTCWVVSGLGGWWGISVILAQYPATEACSRCFAPFGFVAVQWMLWRNAVRAGWRLLAWELTSTPLWLKITACTWLGILVLFQLTCLAALVMLLVWLH